MFQIHNLDIDHERVFQLCMEYSKKSDLDSAHTAHLKNLKTSSQKIDYAESPDRWPILKPLVDLIKEKTQRTEVQYSWFNIMYKGSFVAPHAHNYIHDVKFAITYYPRLEQGHNPIELRINDNWVPVDIKQGQCLIFPGDMLHRVPIQQSNNPRCCIAFNMY